MIASKSYLFQVHKDQGETKCKCEQLALALICDFINQLALALICDFINLSFVTSSICKLIESL